MLKQVWAAAVAKATFQAEPASVDLEPSIPSECLKLSMDFFTFRFLYGAAVLTANIRAKTWLTKSPSTNADSERWSTAALLLLRGSCGVRITPAIAQRAGPMFRGVATADTGTAAAETYYAALEYLQRRGFGEVRVHEHGLPSFQKKHFCFLPESCKKHLQRAGLPAMLFGVHVPVWRGIEKPASRHQPQSYSLAGRRCASSTRGRAYGGSTRQSRPGSKKDSLSSDGSAEVRPKSREKKQRT